MIDHNELYSKIRNYELVEDSFDNKLTVLVKDGEIILTETFTLKSKKDFFNSNFSELDQIFQLADAGYFDGGKDFETTLKQANDSDTQKDLDYKVLLKKTLVENSIITDSISLYNLKSFKNMNLELCNKLTYGPLFNLESKIRIIFFVKPRKNISSSLFSEGVEDIEIPKGITEHEYYRQLNISTFPFMLSKDIDFDTRQYKIAINSMLELISSHSNGNRYYFQSGKTSNIATEQIYYSKSTYEKLSEITYFVFKDAQHSYDKLLIVIKLLADRLYQGSDITINYEFLNLLFIEIKEHHMLYIDKAINSFIQDKQAVLEKQLDLSRNIMQRVKSLNNELFTQLVSITGIIITSFF